MSYKMLIFTGLYTALLVTVAGAQENPDKQYTAKELFLKARQLPYHAATSEATPAPPPKAETAVPKTTHATRPPGKKVDTAPVSKPTTSATPVSTSSSLPEGAAIVRVSAPAPSQGPALGLRYSILRRVNGQMVEVPKDTEFHSGDAIQVKVQTNTPGYLYIVNQGSSGQWMPMFPSAEFQGGNNHVDGWSTYVLPPRAMVFDEQTGVEKLTVLFAREPEPDIEKLIYSLQGTPKPKPVMQKPSSTDDSKTLVASARISDDLVRNKRQMYSRDLVIETVTPNTPGDQKEFADYVVNPSGSPDSRVMADLKLVHK